MAGIIPAMVTISPSLRKTTYNPVTATTSFAVNFPLFDNDDLLVKINGDVRTDYTVSATYVDGISTNASVVMGAGVTGEVVIYGLRTPARTDQFSTGGPLPIDNFNYSLNRLEIEAQEARRDIDESQDEIANILPTVTDLTARAETAATAAEAAESSAEAAAVRASDYADFARNNWVYNGPFVGTGASADYPLTIDPATANNMFVVGGGFEQPPSAYELVYVAGAPHLRIAVPKDVIIDVRMSNAVPIATPADDTVSTAKIQSAAVTTAKIADGAITGAKLAANSVDSSKIVDGTIVTADLANDAVTYAKMQNVSATSRLLGRKTALAGDVEELTPSDIETILATGSPSFFAYLSTPQSVTSATYTKCHLDVESFDSNNAYDNATNYRFNPQVAGKYRVSAAIFGTGTTVSLIRCALYKNGSNFVESAAQVSGSASQVLDVVVQLNGSSDYIELFGMVTAASTPQFGGGASPILSHFSATRIGP